MIACGLPLPACFGTVVGVEKRVHVVAVDSLHVETHRVEAFAGVLALR